MWPMAQVRRHLLALTMLFLLLAPLRTVAQTAPAANTGTAELAVRGRVEHSRTIGLAELEAFPATTVEVAYASAKGPQRSSYTGVLLWALLAAAAPVDESGPHSHLRHTLLAQGRDGYGVALAIGELDPEFEGKQVLIAYAQDGKPLAGLLRLVVPSDARAGRSVRDLVSIEVR